MSGMRSDPRIPFFSVQIELRRFHWPIAAGVRRTRLLAVGIIISNGFEPCIRCTGNATVTHIDSILAQMFEKRHQLLRSEEHTSELQSLMRISYAVFCLKKKTTTTTRTTNTDMT